MQDLLIVLAPIALIDSLSPVRFGALITVLGGRKWLRGGVSFVIGAFVAYLLLGLGITLGADRLLTWLLPAHPKPLDFALSAVIGSALLLVGLLNLRVPNVERGSREPRSEGGLAQFWLAAAITVVTAPAALPYLAAVDRILTAGVNDLQILTALVYYCLLYVAPLVVLVALRVLLGKRASRVLAVINDYVARWIPRLMAVLFLLLGIVLLVDAFGFFFFDRPLW